MERWQRRVAARVYRRCHDEVGAIGKPLGRSVGLGTSRRSALVEDRRGASTSSVSVRVTVRTRVTVRAN